VRKQASVAPWTPPWAGGEDNKKRGRTAPFFQVRIDRIQLNLLFDFLHAGDAHFDATIRRQAGDQLVLVATLPAGRPLPTRKSATVRARASDSFWL